jgi:hypothetical protein
MQVIDRKPALVLALGALLCWAPRAEAFSSFYTSMCAGCHTPTVVGSTAVTCNGCHAHGTHPDSTKSSINVTGATDAASYTPGQTVTVTINGGYRTGWIRAALWDQTMTQLAVSTGPNGMGGGAGYPVTLTAPAPTAPGTYTWNVGWYGNAFDAAGAAFGSRWTPDAGNPNHGYEVVSTNAFTVAAAAAPAITLSPQSLDFGTVTAGTSATRTFTVGNVGTAALAVTVAATAGTSAEFSAAPASFQVAPGGSTTVTVTYAPTDVGTDVGSLAVSSNDPLQPSLPVALTGTGAAAPTPQVVLDPASLNLGSVTVGASATLSTQVRNTGTAALSVSAIAPCAGTSAEFTWSPAAPFTVAAGGATALNVTYAPTGAGADAGCLALTTNDPATPTAQLAVQGLGVAAAAPQLAVSPASLDFGTVTVGQSATRTLTISNGGAAPLSATLTLGPGSSAGFSFTPATATVAAGGSQAVTVTYAPAAAGAASGSIVIASNDPANPSVSVGLTATASAVTAPAIALDPTSIDFGQVIVGQTGQRTVAIRNQGTATLTVSSIALCAGTSAEFAWSPGAPLTVAAGGAAQLVVAYAPVDAGADTGCLTVASDDPAHPASTLALSGSGASPGQLVGDVDIDELDVPGALDTRQARSVVPEAEFRNRSSTAALATATLDASIAGAAVYHQTMPLSIGVGSEAEVTFPALQVQAGTTGAILWVLTVDDANPDLDRATATTRLGPGSGSGGGDRSADGSAVLAAAGAGGGGGCATGGGEVSGWLILSLGALRLVPWRRRR